MAYDFENVRILIVDCSDAMAELLKSVLNMLGIPEKNIDKSLSAEDAIRKFFQIKYDLIITDWMEHPDKGIKLTKEIRTDKDSPNIFIPIMMTAGSGHVTKVLRARDAGITDYCVKPFSAKMLSERLARVIEDKRSFVVSDAFVGPDRRHRVLPDYKGEDRRNSKNEEVIEEIDFVPIS